MDKKMKTEQVSWFANRQVIGLLVVALLVVFVLLSMHCEQRYKDFVSSQHELMDKSAADTVQALSSYIVQTRHTVKLFADTEIELITQLSKYPFDEDAYSKLTNTLQNNIPDYYSFTIADDEGIPMLDDFESTIGEVCLLDLRGFAERWHPSELFIHPNPSQYHFDIMSLINFGEDDQTIFFVSFKPDALIRILASNEIGDHKMMLLHQSKNQLIELTANGTRNMLKRDINLSKDELNSISIEYDVPESLWLLAYLPDEKLFEEKRQYFRMQSLQVFAAVFLFAIVLMFLFRRKKTPHS